MNRTTTLRHQLGKSLARTLEVRMRSAGLVIMLALSAGLTSACSDREVGSEKAEPSEMTPSEVLPEYVVLDVVQQPSGSRYGDILVADYSRSTAVDIREAALRKIMSKEEMQQASLYCSEDAMHAHFSAAFAQSHPDALSTCFLGGISSGQFVAGESIYP
jgi:hypothetical protein